VREQLNAPNRSVPNQLVQPIPPAAAAGTEGGFGHNDAAEPTAAPHQISKATASAAAVASPSPGMGGPLAQLAAVPSSRDDDDLDEVPLSPQDQMGKGVTSQPVGANANLFADIGMPPPPYSSVKR
jgi:hypothetical protein